MGCWPLEPRDSGARAGVDLGAGGGLGDEMGRGPQTPPPQGEREVTLEEAIKVA